MAFWQKIRKYQQQGSNINITEKYSSVSLLTIYCTVGFFDLQVRFVIFFFFPQSLANRTQLVHTQKLP
jgi:hypothetical protein